MQLGHLFEASLWKCFRQVQLGGYPIGTVIPHAGALGEGHLYSVPSSGEWLHWLVYTKQYIHYVHPMSFSFSLIL